MTHINKLYGKVTKKLIDDAMDYCVNLYVNDRTMEFTCDCDKCPGSGAPNYFCGLWGLASDNKLGAQEMPCLSGESDTAKKFFYQLLDPMVLLIEEVEELDEKT
jgi:hypothetical protein